MNLTQEEVYNVEQQHNVKLVDNIPAKRTQRVTWLCTKHNKQFTATVWDVVNNKKRCSECARLKRLASRRASVDEYRRVAADHNLTFVENTVTSPETWRCNTCGAEFQDYFCHIKRSHRHGCPTCSQRHAQHNRRHTVDDYIKLGNQHGFTYLDVNIRPESKKQLVRWQCTTCHAEVNMSYIAIYEGRLCPECRRGSEETMCKDILTSLLGINFEHIRPDWLLSPKGYPLELDMYNAVYDIAFEYQGPQHFHFLRFFHKNVSDFNYRVQTDKIKTECCKAHGTMLVPIPFFKNMTTIEQRTAHVHRVLLKYNVMQWLTSRGWTPPANTSVVITSPQKSLRKFQHRPAATADPNKIDCCTSLPLTATVFTPTGFKQVVDVHTGDYVYTERGKAVQVVHECVNSSEQTYRVQFTDGTQVIVGANQAFKYITRNNVLAKVWRFATLSELMTRHYLTGTRNAYNLSIPVCHPVRITSKKPLISSYIIGALLGAGNLTSEELYFSKYDADVLSLMNSEIADRGQFVDMPTSNHARIQFVDNHGQPQRKPLYKIITELTSGKRLIPNKYMLTMTSDRIRLLQGIVDTCGNVDIKGHVRVVVSHKAFAQSILALAQSLGYRATVTSSTRTRDKYTLAEHKVYISGVYNQLFTSKHHLQAFQASKIPKTHHHYELLSIVSIEPCACVTTKTILLAGQRHTVLVNDFIVLGA